ncbi:4Fe-4S dicluster domain-containing protein [Pseudocitrobacter cyperus]|uniref:4Fe-4S dicluster domain-containing protein n=1 Tax=Pseudocitrobacter cyperus TaxID=3112843 RepID=A0ABV0HJL4_9ENTR
MKAFIVADEARCIACRTCEVACALAHSAEDAGQLAAFSPRLKVQRLGEVSVPVMCHQCERASCVEACPVGALTIGKRAVDADDTRCIGCLRCVIACPFGAITVETPPGAETSAILKCDLCGHREEGPACVGTCPTQALQLMTDAELRRYRRGRIAKSAVHPR